MPTYTNASTTETKIVTDINGVITDVAPGASIQTYEILGTGWTKTSDSPIAVTAVKVYQIATTTGSFQPITLPSNLMGASSILIQVHNGIASDFTSFKADPVCFHFSTTGASDNNFIQCIGSFSVDILDRKSPTIGYVRAISGLSLVVCLLP